MSVQSELNRLKSAKTGLKTVLEQNGAAVPSGATLDEYPALFAALVQDGSVYLYKATFSVSRWTASGSNYTQSAAVTPLAGAPAVSSAFTMASPLFVEDSFPDATQQLVKLSGGVVDAGQKSLGSGTITCTTRNGKKPISDVEVFFLAKKGE